ncbi:hypothetical protein [Lichenicoccus sp.]|uniref:hypothetical protein n=1 Tax=Lichenicoccus sp. TaxID=2781899 RepID=UPI003D14CF15
MTPIVIDGEPALSVETFGRHGGKPFIIDADRWPEVVESWGARWTVMTTGTGHFYVASARKQATQAATRRRAHCPLAYLARLLTSADEDEVVGFVNGNPFDMRVSNMELLTRAEVLWRHSNRLTA